MIKLLSKYIFVISALLLIQNIAICTEITTNMQTTGNLLIKDNFSFYQRNMYLSEIKDIVQQNDNAVSKINSAVIPNSLSSISMILGCQLAIDGLLFGHKVNVSNQKYLTAAEYLVAGSVFNAWSSSLVDDAVKIYNNDLLQTKDYVVSTASISHDSLRQYKSENGAGYALWILNLWYIGCDNPKQLATTFSGFLALTMFNTKKDEVDPGFYVMGPNIVYNFFAAPNKKRDGVFLTNLGLSFLGGGLYYLVSSKNANPKVEKTISTNNMTVAPLLNDTGGGLCVSWRF